MATTVKVTKWHTYNGEEHAVGDVYTVEDDAIGASIIAQGMATREGEEAAPPAPESQPVEPMTTENFGIAERT